MVRFGSTVTCNAVVVYVAYNLEKVLLGRYWGAEVLGLYGRAYQLINLPLEQLAASTNGVAFATFSRLQGDSARLCRFFLKFYSLLLSLILPVLISTGVATEGVHPSDTRR
jgi:PST family polysaccharide transporter